MPTNNDETPTKKTLREKTQSFRNKARRILRMEKINDILQEIFMVNRQLTNTEKEIEKLTKEKTSAEKITARAEYKVSNLDPEDPDFDEKVVKAETFVETEKERQEKVLKQISSNIKSYTEDTKNYTKEIGELGKAIEAVESGEIKISIDRMNELANELISES